MMILCLLGLIFGLFGMLLSFYGLGMSLTVHQKQIAFLNLELEKKQAQLDSWGRYCKELEAQVIDLNQQLRLKEAGND